MIKYIFIYSNNNIAKNNEIMINKHIIKYISNNFQIYIDGYINND